MYQQCNSVEVQAIATATSYEQLRDIALAQLTRMYDAVGARPVINHRPHPITIGIVCGPISNGGVGKGDVAINMKVFSAAVTHFVQQQDGFFFSQVPFEDKIKELKQPDVIALGKPVANQKLLDVFYAPLFASGLIQKMHFLPDWRTSDGARWERQRGEQLGIAIHDIPMEIAQAFLAAAD